MEILGAILLVLLAIVLGGVYYCGSQTAEATHPIKSLVLWVGAMLGIGLALASVLLVIAASARWINESPSSYLKARCESVEGTVYNYGKCYKNGIEIKWSEWDDKEGE